MLTGAHGILATADVAATIQFYTEVLGFTSSWTYGDPPTFGAVTWGKVTIMFNLNPDLASRVEGHQHWIDVDDVDALNALHLERGARIVEGLEDKPWGKREYTVSDPSGYHLRFTGSPLHASKGSGVMPPEVKIECRIPTEEEYTKVAGGAFYQGKPKPGVLERTWRAVVATDSHGMAIGILRVMNDAPGWFSIWDVAVLPKWQGQRIGTAMMQAALDMIRAESPGANVYLFTYNHNFYERLGFSQETVDLVKF